MTTTEISTELLDAISSACAAIERDSIKPSPTPPYREIYPRLISSECEPKLKCKLLAISDTGVALLRNARKNAIVEANLQLENLCLLIEGVAEAFVLEHLLIRSMSQPRIALLDYRQGDFKSAMQRLESAFIADCRLEEEFGVSGLVPHRLNLMRQYSRIQFEKGFWQQSQICQVASLAYLDAQCAECMLSLPRPWSQGWESKDQVDWHGQRNGLHHDFASQLLAYTETKRQPFASHYESDNPVDACVRSTQVGLWDQIVQESSEGVICQSLALEFLSTTHRSRPLLVDGMRRISSSLAKIE